MKAKGINHNLALSSLCRMFSNMTENSTGIPLPSALAVGLYPQIVPMLVADVEDKLTVNGLFPICASYAFILNN